MTPPSAKLYLRQFRLGMASYRKSLLTLNNMLKMCFSCFMNTNISA